MTARMRATGLNATPRWVWIHYSDNGLLVPRRYAVQVPWGMIADAWQALGHGVDREFTRRIEAEANVAQLPLPLEAWE